MLLFVKYKTGFAAKQYTIHRYIETKCAIKPRRNYATHIGHSLSLYIQTNKKTIITVGNKYKIDTLMFVMKWSTSNMSSIFINPSLLCIGMGSPPKISKDEFPKTNKRKFN